ncbi:dipeptide ABC transporter ATP-binding protein [Kordiimonas sp.]|uniref:dipeptide ABC transporter ATP-binding protein n=1 Tax=Kordiimonas sp. TaxID=1970157 RepID=UPI003A9263BD
MSKITIQKPLLDIRDLSIAFPGAAGPIEVVSGASLRLMPGEVHSVVGESGSGKTMIARAVMGLLPPGGKVTAGSLHFQGQDITCATNDEMRSLRGVSLGMVFQEPMMSLNPAMRIGRQMAEAMALHTALSEAEIRQASIDMLARVRMPDPAGCLNRYPHEFSGGMRQRIMLASVLMLKPKLLIADEPTTALDVLIQKEVMDIMMEIVAEEDTAVLLISHDLGLVAHYTNQVTVMRRGVVMECGSVSDILAAPKTQYTKDLLAALPGQGGQKQASATSRQKTIVQMNDVSVVFRQKARLPWLSRAEVRAVDGVSLDIAENEIVAVVGESGSGKTTLGRALLKLTDIEDGSIREREHDIMDFRGEEDRAYRRRTQIIFQDPYSSLDPRQRIGSIIGEGLRHDKGLSAADKAARVVEVMEACGLPPEWRTRFPHELSGGQRQRVGIARAIVTKPALVVADEAVSALDVTVQAQVLELLKKLQRDLGFSCLFITHDIGVVEEIADRVVVMYKGQVVEMGPKAAVLSSPAHPYTCALLNAVPGLEGTAETGLQPAARSHMPVDPPVGWLHDQRYLAKASEPRPKLLEIGAGHFVALTISTEPVVAA